MPPWHCWQALRLLMGEAVYAALALLGGPASPDGGGCLCSFVLHLHITYTINMHLAFTIIAHSSLSYCSIINRYK